MAAIVTIGLKFAAFSVTRSVGLLSDAMESGVNLAAALVALLAITVAAFPPDDDHAFGHHKAEYFSSVVQGVLIVVAAVLIVASAVERLQSPQPAAQLAVGIALLLVAMGLNFIVARILARAGKQHRSVALEADAHHLMSDVWTSAGVLLGIAALWLTGWQWLDVSIAFGVAVHLLFVGGRLVHKSLLGLMDTAWPSNEQAQLHEVLRQYVHEDVTFHALRTRLSGSLRFASLHMQVPGDWSVREGHVLMERVERDIRQQLSPVSIMIHIEPVEDPVSWDDIALVRPNSEN